MRDSDLTVVIIAKDSAKTIVRAIESVRKQGYPIVLVDDHSKDNTVHLAREAGEGHVTIARPIDQLGRGNLRQTGIDNIDTRYLAWLDASDEFLPGRVERMEWQLKSGLDFVFDAVEHCNAKGERIRLESIPEFLKTPLGMLRLFERNYLPSLAWPGMLTAYARQVGYDTSLDEGEDLDFILRALKWNPKIGLLKEVGYKCYDKEELLSKILTRRREATSKAMARQDYFETHELLVDRGYDPRVANWTLCQMAIFRGDWGQARDFIKDAFPEDANSNEVFDTDSPCPRKEGWKQAFFLGTIDLAAGGRDEKNWLAKAEEFEPTAEAANNRGVSFAREENLIDARKCFEKALERFPEYNDARINLKSLSTASKITIHPLRP